jgi:multidrug efflux pump subunit AcrA (membrane-fusion protein)
VVGIAPDATLQGGVVDYEVHIRIADKSADLKPQMTASVSISGPSQRALVVPTAAVRQSEMGAFVWQRKNGVAQRTPVALGARQADLSEVRSGLLPGDTVLTGNFPESR